MNSLYSDLAKVYDAMYATFIDYKDEYEFYSEVLKKYNKKSLLEIGSGTGNLTTYFKKNGFEYLGFDLNEEMLEIARIKNPDCIYIKGDMRSFKLEKPVESIIMTGRTISYLLSNQDVESTLKSIHNNLEKGGVFCFDFIDANKFIPEISEGKEITHEASYDNIYYVRKSKWNLNLKQGMDFIWESNYYKKEGKKLIEIGKDNSIIRTFTINEIEIFLQINNFEIRKIIKKKSYAFPTYAIIALKK
ncbi:hypothetical protein ATO12_14960 [Aquimarina atlantica]|uniref:Methyltransferase domain-containing protein n=1 Tax=Aquimarina atlantica TaxID=1317122 RepID=A0A023BVV7_9FLAO|nr:class I SAM-dependent methyltransferase [Aquimarina atlantica]EZH74167.1 hypothetical protein ATO12_14960 [Aquimarina atlantica]